MPKFKHEILLLFGTYHMTHPKGQGGLGFRDLHTFNLAMIAKQGWKILTNPHTLVARIYKARGTFQIPLFF
jgi:hypothetical protein